jgi:alkaline phosphatase D
VNRREFLKHLRLGAIAAPVVISACKAQSPDNANSSDNGTNTPLELPLPGAGNAAAIFPSSVASGDPTPSGAMLWTRVAAEHIQIDQPLLWEIASDEGFSNVVARGAIAASFLSASSDYTIKLDTDGLLGNNQFYFYRFAYGDTSSRIGRMRTLPLADEAVDQLKMILVTCQDFTLGRFHAYREIATVEADYLLHLGDFIYESAIIGIGPDRLLNLPSGQQYAVDLNDCRFIYKTHRAEAELQEALEKHTLIHTWDDHEIANDRYWDGERPRGPDHPLDSDPVAFTQYTRDAIQAWYEYLPVRVPYDPDGDFPDLIEVERSFRFGNLAELVLTELRMHRDPHPCGEGNFGERQLVLESSCEARHEPDRTMMGSIQRNWMLDTLADSDAQWKVLGLPIPFSPIQISQLPAAVYEIDHWDGYTDERRIILQALADRDVNNLIVLSGDLHAFLAAQLFSNYDGSGEPIGAEFATSAVAATPIASINPPANVFLQQLNIQANNPHINFWDGTRNGWCEVTITPTNCRVVMRAMLAQLPIANPSLPLAEFNVDADNPLLQRL